MALDHTLERDLHIHAGDHLAHCVTYKTCCHQLFLITCFHQKSLGCSGILDPHHTAVHVVSLETAECKLSADIIVEDAVVYYHIHAEVRLIRSRDRNLGSYLTY